MIQGTYRRYHGGAYGFYGPCIACLKAAIKKNGVKMLDNSKFVGAIVGAKERY